MKGPKGPLPCYVDTQPLCGLVDDLPVLISRKTVSASRNNAQLAMGEERCRALQVGQGNS